MIHEVKGNLLDTDCPYICHQTNCAGKMNSGVAKAIREKWPVVYEQYYILFRTSTQLLGHIQLVQVTENQTVINLFGQNSFGYDGKRYTSYDAFWTGLGEIRKYVPVGSAIAFPKNIGSCRGGANWNVIKTMIAEALCDYEVYIYELEET